MAILNDQSPRVLIELKAMYSFDAALDTEGVRGFIAAMSADENKARDLAEENTEIYTVLLATHPEGSFPSNMNGIIKYVPGINNAVKRFGSANKVKSIASEAVNLNLCNKNLVASGILKGGNAFDTEVSVYYWIVKA